MLAENVPAFLVLARRANPSRRRGLQFVLMTWGVGGGVALGAEEWKKL